MTLVVSLLRQACRASSSSISKRSYQSSSSTPARHAIGRIQPKRIAVSTGRSVEHDFAASGGHLDHTTAGSSFGSGGFERPPLWKPIGFALGLGGAGYAFAAAYTNTDTAEWQDKLGKGSWWRSADQPDTKEIQRAKKIDLAKRLQARLDSLPTTLSSLPEPVRVPILRLYVTFAEALLQIPASQLATVACIVPMGGVFIMWKMRGLKPFMNKWFLHHPVGRDFRPITMFTSIISHQSLPHFAFNSIALYSFGAAAYNYLATPPEGAHPLPSSTNTPQFLAFLLAAGLASSLSSHLFTSLVRLPRLLATLSSPARVSAPSALAAHGGISPSLGASGAIYAALTVTGSAYPDAGISLIFIPWYSIPIGYGMVGMIGLDVLGIIRGWRMFDHVAHLGGAVFGLVYYRYGREWWDSTRRALGGKERGVGSVF